MSASKENTGLGIIFSIFLGIMVMAFIGVGVFTFYPMPDVAGQERLEDLYRDQEDIQRFRDPTALTEEDRAKLTQVQAEIREVEDELQADREIWGRNTSIILITFATITMAISLIRSEQLPVISNGLLLGGVFTMIYGVGWIIATGTSYGRFLVIAAALGITLVLGYLRFVRRKEAAVQVIAGGEVAGLEARLDELERRLTLVGAALSGEKP